MALMTLKETAERLGLSHKTVWQMAKEGRIPATRVGKSWRVGSDKLDEFLSANTSEPPESVQAGVDIDGHGSQIRFFDFTSFGDGRWMLEPKDGYRLVVKREDGRSFAVEFLTKTESGKVVAKLKSLDDGTDAAMEVCGKSILNCESGESAFLDLPKE